MGVIIEMLCGKQRKLKTKQMNCLVHLEAHGSSLKWAQAILEIKHIKKIARL